MYDALITQVERYDGTIISFAGDAITCWFAGDAAPSLATSCAFALLDTMPLVEQIALPDGATASIGLKVAVATGTVRRFVVGDPQVQHIDVLAGATIARMATREGEAERGEVVVDRATVTRLGSDAHVVAWRACAGERFAVLERVATLPTPPPIVQPSAQLDDAALRLNQMLDDLRPLLDLATLEAALARGSARDMDTTSVTLLTALEQR